MKFIMLRIIILTVLTGQQWQVKSEDIPRHLKLGNQLFPETDRGVTFPGSEKNTEKIMTLSSAPTRSKRTRRSEMKPENDVFLATDALGKISATLRFLKVTEPNVSKIPDRYNAVHIYRKELGFLFDTLRVQAKATVEILKSSDPLSRRKIDYSSFFSSLGEACNSNLQAAKSGLALLKQIQEENEGKGYKKRRNSTSRSPLHFLLQNYPQFKNTSEPNNSENGNCIAEMKLNTTAVPTAIAENLEKVHHYKVLFVCDISRHLDDIANILTHYSVEENKELTNAFETIEHAAANAAIAFLSIKVRGIRKNSRWGGGEGQLFEGAGKLCSGKMTLLGALAQMAADYQKSQEGESGKSSGGYKSEKSGMGDLMGLILH